MTERFNPYYHPEDIPRRSPTLEFQRGDHVERLTWYNTLIVFYTQDKYLDMTHVEITDHENGSRWLQFECRSLVQVLMQHHFPMMSAPEPRHGVLEAYYQYQADEMEQELPELMEDDE
ncbi:hypothetical protein [Rhodococcus sp. B10]|uniref:hypothetical protein n=1 Tax=Rhodococcus sp. B10 TaxID=2695876 RepID=UPI001430F7AF|nr:hypothetical protein [Rhodococcus sp. B10]NIL77164.1 hypothetical protein [Rhodococcus sp. B10]